MTATTIVLIRHGQTEWNRAERLHGRSDLPLNATGIAQAHSLAAELSCDGPWDAVYSSPLFRARQSAQILADALGIAQVQENPELMERDFGESEGRLVKGLDEEQRRLLMDVGETEDHLVQRGVNALFKISVQHPRQRVLVVSHAAWISSVLTALSGEAHSPLANAQMIELDPALLGNFVAREPLWH